MTDKAIKKEEVKKQIRALLLSAPAPLTVGELKRDFHSFMGESIAFNAAGYHSMEDMLSDMQDAVQISWKNGMMVLQAVADETTRHIESLVSRQKIPNPKKYAALRRAGRPPGPSQYYQPGRQSGPSHYYQPGPPRYRGRPQAQPLLQTPVTIVPAFVRNQMKQLFKSYANGLPLTHFETAFARRFGVHLNFEKFGFISIKEMLLSIPDVVHIQQYEGGEVRVMDASYKTRNTEMSRPEQKPPSLLPTPTGHEADQMRTPRGRGQRISASSGSENKSIGAVSEHSANADNGQGEIDTDAGISEKIQIRIQQLLASKPKGVWARRLPFEYKDMHGQNLCITDQGYLSVIEFVSALPSVIRIERPNPKGDWLLFDARIPTINSETETKELPVQTEKPPVSTDQESKTFVIEAIKMILYNNPKGILVSELPHLFKELTDQELNMKKFGFSKIESFLLSLPENILQFSYVGAGRILLLPMHAENENAASEDSEDNENTDMKEEDIQDIPDDAVGPSNYYTPLDIPCSSDYLEIFVSNVVTPGLFWIHLKGKRTTSALEKMMDDIERVYKSCEGDRYQIPENMIKVGQLCAVLFPEDCNWHRGVITAKKDNNFVEVYYVDYGNTCSVQKKSLRLLRTKFLSLPAQAIQARLANIQPGHKTQNWTIVARNRMLDMCRSRPLIALVTAEKDRVMSICLTDTSGATDIHINDILVQEGYAKFNPDDMHTNLSGPKQHAELPDYSYVFGWKQQQTTAYVQGIPQSQAADPQEIKHYVQSVKLTSEHEIHLINLERIAYVTSEDISAFFWDEDIITSLLRQKNVEARKLIVSRKDYPYLFEELQQMGVKSVAESDPPRAFITLYELLSLPNILEVFQHPSVELHKNVQGCIQQFNPDDPYWKVTEVSVTESSSQEDMVAPHMSSSELSLTLQLLQFKRKRILQTMLMDPQNTSDMVNELNQVEAQIVSIKSLLESSIQTAQDRFSTPTVQQPGSVITSKVVSNPDRAEMTAKVKPTLKPSSQPLKTNVVSPIPQTPPVSQPAGVNTIASANQNVANMTQIQQMYQSMLSVGALNPQMMSIMNPMMNPMMFPYMQMTGMTNQMPSLPALGRGQQLPSNMLLPELMPLLQNLNQLRGSTPGQGSGPSSKTKQFADSSHDQC